MANKYLNKLYDLGEKHIPYFKIIFAFWKRVAYVSLYLQTKLTYFFLLTWGGRIFYMISVFSTHFFLMHKEPEFDQLLPLVKYISLAIGVGILAAIIDFFFIFKINHTRKFLNSLFGENFIVSHFGNKRGTQALKVAIGVHAVVLIVYIGESAALVHFSEVNAQAFFETVMETGKSVSRDEMTPEERKDIISHAERSIYYLQNSYEKVRANTVFEIIKMMVRIEKTLAACQPLLVFLVVSVYCICFFRVKPKDV